MTSPEEAGTPELAGPSCLVEGTCKQNKDGSLYWPRRYWSPDGGFLPDGGCIVRTGEAFPINASTSDVLTTCFFESGSSMVFQQVEAVDAGEAGGSDSGPSPARTPVKPAPVSTPAAAVEEAHAEAAEVAAKAQAVVEHPAAAVADLKSAIPADANIFTVLLGGIAVLGGGAAWKFYSDHSKRKHEQEMAKIERQSNPGECKGHAAIKTEVAELSEKVDDVSERVDEASEKLEAIAKKVERTHLTMGDFDAEEVEERLEKVEKVVKKLRKAADSDDE